MTSLYGELNMMREAEYCEGLCEERAANRAYAYAQYVELCASKGESPDEECESCDAPVDEDNYCEGRYAETLCDDCGEAQGL